MKKLYKQLKPKGIEKISFGLTIAIITLLIIILLTGCEDFNKFPKFKIREIVTHKLSNAKAQILSIHFYSNYRNSYQYTIRIYYPTVTTDTHVFSKDDPVKFQILDEIEVWGFELEPLTKGK